MMMEDSFPQDHIRTTPSLMLAVNIRSPALEYFISVMALLCPDSVARSLSFEGAATKVRYRPQQEQHTQHNNCETLHGLTAWRTRDILLSSGNILTPKHRIDWWERRGNIVV